MRGGYQIIDLSTATIGSESIINDVYQTIKHFDGKPVFIITPNTSGVFAEFTENNGMYIGAYIGSNSHLYTVSIISSNRVTITDKGPAGGGGTSNYNELSNKPAIAGNTLSGDKPLSDFGIQGALIAGANISIDANNEISANVDSIAASSVTYNNTSSGMTANNVQDAITELNSNIGTLQAKFIHKAYFQPNDTCNIGDYVSGLFVYADNESRQSVYMLCGYSKSNRRLYLISTNTDTTKLDISLSGDNIVSVVAYRSATLSGILIGK